MAKEFNICFMFLIWLKTFRKFTLFDIATPEHRNLFCFVLFLLIFLVSARVLVSCCLCFAVCFCLFLFIQFFLPKSTKSSRAYPVTNNACHFGFQQVFFFHFSSLQRKHKSGHSWDQIGQNKGIDTNSPFGSIGEKKGRWNLFLLLFFLFVFPPP